MTAARIDPVRCASCGSSQIKQDPDVLDTWFSSGLWPFSTLGWPAEAPDFKYFYPTTMMETGYDILFFWVARMIMMGLEFTGEIPFSIVYLHGLIRDEHGRKMSKTYGNVIDPLTVMDELGTDALRFTLLVGSTPGNDMNLSLKRVEANRNFANKIWNASRFVLSALRNLEEKGEPDGAEGQSPAAGLYPPIPYPLSEWTLADRWIYARQAALVRDVERLFQSYQYGEAGRQIYEFFWNDFADWYVEIAKQQSDRPVTPYMLVHVLDICLRLLHPFTPFVTEELWGHLKQAVEGKSIHSRFSPDALMVAPWPETQPEASWEAETIAQFTLVQDVVRAIRNLRAEKGVKPGKRISARIAAGEKLPILESQAKVIGTLAQLAGESLTLQKSVDERVGGDIALVVSGIEVYLPLADLVDTAPERARLEKELAGTENQVKRLEELLAGPFAQKAPPAVVQKERDKLGLLKETVSKLREKLSGSV